MFYHVRSKIQRALFFILCVPHCFIPNTSNAHIVMDDASFFAYLYHIDTKQLEDFRNTVRSTYASVWHNLLNEKNTDATSCPKSLSTNINTIPKIVHFIWFGNPMPQINLDYIETWKKYHPHWRFYVWDENLILQVFKNRLENQMAFDHALYTKNYAEASDIARYEILKYFGGLYVDSDTKCHKSFDLMHKNFHFYVGMEQNHDFICGNALIGSIPNHPIINLVISDIKKDYMTRHRSICNDNTFITLWKENWLDHIDNQTVGNAIATIVLTGPGCLTRNITQYYATANQERIGLTLVAPKKYFYGDDAIFSQHESHNSWIKTSQ